LTVTDQRKSRRFELNLPFELLRSGSERAMESGETRNLSSCGVLFRSSARVQPGATVEYRITLPSNGADLRLHCIGKVVRCITDWEAAATLERYEFVRG